MGLVELNKTTTKIFEKTINSMDLNKDKSSKVISVPQGTIHISKIKEASWANMYGDILDFSFFKYNNDHQTNMIEPCPLYPDEKIVLLRIKKFNCGREFNGNLWLTAEKPFWFPIGFSNIKGDIEYLVDFQDDKIIEYNTPAMRSLNYTIKQIWNKRLQSFSVI